MTNRPDPACDPGAGLLATIRMAAGASLSFAHHEPDAEADRILNRVIKALGLPQGKTKAAEDA